MPPSSNSHPPVEVVDLAVPSPRRPPSLAEIQKAGERLHQALEDAVVRCRLNGGSWSDVGRGLGISKSAAFRRFRHLDDEAGHVLLVSAGGRSSYVSERLQEPLPFEPRARRAAVRSAVSTLASIAS